MRLKEFFVTAAGIVGAFISTALGGWDTGLQTLVVFMILDYVTGLIVAGVFKKSGKSENGALDSRAGWKGLFKKGMTLLVVLIGHRLDLVMGTSVIREAVIIAYIVNETLSIIENAGLMGLPIPKMLRDAIDILKTRADGDDEKL